MLNLGKSMEKENLKPSVRSAREESDDSIDETENSQDEDFILNEKKKSTTKKTSNSKSKRRINKSIKTKGTIDKKDSSTTAPSTTTATMTPTITSTTSTTTTTTTIKTKTATMMTSSKEISDILLSMEQPIKRKAQGGRKRKGIKPSIFNDDGNKIISRMMPKSLDGKPTTIPKKSFPTQSLLYSSLEKVPRSKIISNSEKQQHHATSNSSSSLPISSSSSSAKSKITSNALSPSKNINEPSLVKPESSNILLSKPPSLSVISSKSQEDLESINEACLVEHVLKNPLNSFAIDLEAQPNLSISSNSNPNTSPKESLIALEKVKEEQEKEISTCEDDIVDSGYAREKENSFITEEKKSKNLDDVSFTTAPEDPSPDLHSSSPILSQQNTFPSSISITTPVQVRVSSHVKNLSESTPPIEDSVLSPESIKKNISTMSPISNSILSPTYSITQKVDVSSYLEENSLTSSMACSSHIKSEIIHDTSKVSLFEASSFDDGNTDDYEYDDEEDDEEDDDESDFGLADLNLSDATEQVK